MGQLISAANDGRVRHLTLNRPDRLNALNSAVLTELLYLLEEAAADVSVSTVIITGAGDRAFCAGADLDEINGLTTDQAHSFIQRGHRVMAAVAASPVPIVAAVDGFALGGGLELMLACHVVIASTRSSFGLPEAKIGCIPGFGGTQRLLTTVGKAAGLHLMLSGDRIDADRAWAIGLLSVPPVDPAHFDTEVQTLGTTLAAGSRTGLKYILEAARQAADTGGLEHEAALAAMAISSPDGREGIQAFAQRRPPNF